MYLFFKKTYFQILHVSVKLVIKTEKIGWKLNMFGFSIIKWMEIVKIFKIHCPIFTFHLIESF